MATTSQSTTEVECPLCGKYRGEPSSVEAHISRKTDEAHKGETGNQHREKLQPGGEPSTPESTASSSSESSSSESSSSGSSSTEKRSGGLPLAGPVEETDESSGESSEEDAEGDEEEEVVIPVPSKPEESEAAESDESDGEKGDGEEEDFSLVTVALLAVGGYIAFRIVTSGSGGGARNQRRPPGV